MMILKCISSFFENFGFYLNAIDTMVGKCDFVMANPPFNVNKVDKKSDYVKNDCRLFDEVGIPKADNGNYLWIQYFYHYLNEQGRAGFVMASSATDAGNTEKLIRKTLIETGAVDCIVAVGNNFFYTRSLPCHLWFLDRGKREKNQDKILMIDARNTLRKINTTINDFSPGQLRNFSAIMAAYRGDEAAITQAGSTHQEAGLEQTGEIIEGVNRLRRACRELIHEQVKGQPAGLLNFSAAKTELQQALSLSKDANHAECEALITEFEQPAATLSQLVDDYKTRLDGEKKAMIAAEKKSKRRDTAQRKQLDARARQLRELNKPLTTYHEQYTQSSVGEPLHDYKQALKDWSELSEHFPEGDYRDIEGLCKVVDLEEVAENDYSLTPGRYVGYSIQIDEDFDYQGRMKEIREELVGLSAEANALMATIQGVEL